MQALDEWDDEHAAAHDDLLGAQVSGDLAGFRVGDRLPLLAGDDVGLIGAGDLVAARNEPYEEDDEQYCPANSH